MSVSRMYMECVELTDFHQFIVAVLYLDFKFMSVIDSVCM